MLGLFRNSVRYFTINHKANSCLNSNLEVLQEIQTKNQSTLSEIDIESLKKYQRIGHGRKHINQINEYFNSKPSLRLLKDIIPASYLWKKRSLKNEHTMFLVDKDVACDIFRVLRPHLETYNGHILEINAGAGVLTEELLKAELHNLRIYEPDAVLCNHLLKLIKLYKSDARLFMANLLALGSIMKADLEDNGGRAETLLDGLPSLNWEDEPVVKLIGALPNERFIHHIMFSMTLQSGLCKHGRPELFLIFSPEEYKKFKSKPSEEKFYRSSSVTFQVLFDHEELARVPENVFIPWRANPRAKKVKSQCKEISDHLCLVRITPKKHLQQTIAPDLLKPFWFFVKFLMRKKSSLLIDIMEKWIPGSGVRLISKGYTIFTDCGSLTPEEYLEIYLEFTSWPEFHSSSFLPSVEGLLGKVLQYSLAEEALSDEQFNRLLNKESNVPDEDVDVFDDSENLEHRDTNVSVDGKGS